MGDGAEGFANMDLPILNRCENNDDMIEVGKLST